MLVRKYPQPWHRTMSIGMFFLVAGALSLRFLARISGMSTDLADGLSGLFYGLAIGCMLLSLRMRGRNTPRP
jgi:hypothetical protein